MMRIIGSCVPSPLRGEGQGEGFSAFMDLLAVTPTEPLTRRYAPTSPLRGEVKRGCHP